MVKYFEAGCPRRYGFCTDLESQGRMDWKILPTLQLHLHLQYRHKTEFHTIADKTLRVYNLNNKKVLGTTEKS